MKLVRYGRRGEERPGRLDSQGRVRDLSGHVRDLAGADLGPEVLARLAALDPERLPLVDGAPRLGPCVGRVGKLVCVGLNYSDHARESGMAAPSEPILFMKATTAICGAFDDVELPPASSKVDWEVELGVVIGRRAKRAPLETSLEHVAGYCVVNDLSERDWSEWGGGQWMKGKSADTFAPLGPWLVTRDEVPDPQALDLWLEVDGHRYQHSNTRNMIFDVRHLVSYVSRFMTLEPGDVISTGTPPGVGLGLKPPRYLRDGHTMRLAVQGLGEQRLRVIRSG